MPLIDTISALRRLGSATQAQLAEVTGTPQRTISHHLQQLKVREKEGRNVQNQPVKTYSLAEIKGKTRVT